MTYPILDKITSPEDIKSLSRDELCALCGEIRSFLVENVSRTGGHLASNLGVVELTVAMHRAFDSPRDHILFDVGHQSYVHKLITGRRDGFASLRSVGGLSGFTRREESPHDPFGAGHSSTALSAALGFAEADAIRGEKNWTVAVVGDGAYTGGLVHEALNNCKRDLRLIMVLNENRMSISRNRGAFASYLSRVRVSRSYLRVKGALKTVLGALPWIGARLVNGISRLKARLKRTLFPLTYFEQLGLYYIGTVDGHDLSALERAFTEAKRLDKSVVIHVKTKKGKGYSQAEKLPDRFHSIHPHKGSHPSFHDVFTEELVRMARADKTVVGITAAMGLGTGLADFGELYPDRYFDVGIAEGHAFTFAAGLAAAGMRPYVTVYSTFLQRAYDNVLHDIAIQHLPVRMIIDRAGLNPSDGVTHHGIFDVSFLSSLDGVDILAPIAYGSLRSMLRDYHEKDAPMALRYEGRPESERLLAAFYPDGDYDAYGIRPDTVAKTHPDALILTYGASAERALMAQQTLRERGIPVGVIALERLAPYRELAEGLCPYLDGVRRIVFLEDGVLHGGAAMHLGEALSSLGALKHTDYRILAIEHPFAAPDAPCDLYAFHGIDADTVIAHFEN